MNLETKIVREDREKTFHGSFIDPEYVLHIVLSGTFSIQIQQTVYAVEPGDLILIPPNKLHALNSASGVHMLVVHFYDHAKSLETFGLMHVVTLSPSDSVTVNRHADELKQLWHTDKQHVRHICDGLLHTIIGYFIVNNGGQIKKQGQFQFYNWKSIQQAITYIQEHFRSTTISIHDVSNHCHLSYNYFSHLFKQYTGESPHHYLIRLRLEYAKECLHNTKLTVSQAAQQSGFCNLQYFSRIFRKYEGISPREWLQHYIDEAD